jgi:DNA-binding response OmpR family regulator
LFNSNYYSDLDTLYHLRIFAPLEFILMDLFLGFDLRLNPSTLMHDRVTLLELCLLILVRFRRNHTQKHSNDQHRSCTKNVWIELGEILTIVKLGAVSNSSESPIFKKMPVYNMYMDTRPKLLLVDDETAITDRLAPFLSRSGFDVKVAVDGEAALRLAPFLSRSGFDVKVAVDGEAALKEIIAYSPDLVILDVLMPRIDGCEVLRQLRGQGDWTPIILLTQVGESAERAMALLEGADDYINKPFDPNELVARIKTVLRRTSPGQPPLTVTERLRSGDLVVDRTKRRAYLKAVEIV